MSAPPPHPAPGADLPSTAGQSGPEARKPGSPEARKPGGVVAERADRWSTVPVRRRVLGVVRTLTALDRLQDVFAVLADDFRVEARFAVAEGSEFGADLRGFLDAAGMRSLPWESATREHVDLAVSPSSNVWLSN